MMMRRYGYASSSPFGIFDPGGDKPALAQSCFSFFEYVRSNADRCALPMTNRFERLYCL
jgi:hypothetical protein